MSKVFFDLTKRQISILKGIAILMIVLHNFLNKFGSGENEMNYDFASLQALWDNTLNVPASFLTGFFTYFGHFGVQLFIFASSYGLTKKYFADKKIQYKEYISYRLIKIYALVLFGLVVSLCYKAVAGQLDFSVFLKNTLQVLSMTNNFSYDRIFSYIGPWWFFSLIIQLYFLFPFLYQYIRAKGLKGFYTLLILSYVLIYILFSITEKAGIPLFGNFVGHLPEFLLGIALAFFPECKIQSKCIGFMAVVFIGSNLSVYAFPFSFFSATLLLLALIYPVLFASKTKALVFVGEISMFMFIINGQLRSLTLKFMLDKTDNPLVIYAGAIFHLICTIVISYILYRVYNKTVLPWSNKLFKKSKNLSLRA